MSFFDPEARVVLATPGGKGENLRPLGIRETIAHLAGDEEPPELRALRLVPLVEEAAGEDAADGIARYEPQRVELVRGRGSARQQGGGAQHDLGPDLGHGAVS